MKTQHAALCLGLAAALQAQPLSWSDPGTYDHAGHQGRMPGDPDVPQGTPPGFAAGLAHPSSLKLQPTGMDFLPDGRLVVAHWGGFGKQGRIHILSGMSGDREAIQSEVIASGLWEPFGLKALGDTLWFTAQDGLWRLTPKAGAPGWDLKRTSEHIVPVKAVGTDFPIVFNAAYHGGKFHYSLGAYKNFNPRGQNEGYVVSIDKSTGAQSILARGVRMPNGLAANAMGDLFYADNQGEYRPSSAIFHVVKGRHYGMAAPDGREGNLGGAMTRMLPLPPADSIFPPAVHVPYRPGSASLTNLFHLEQGAFAGQFLAGDNAYGAVHRIQVEKVGGEYQGACFTFSGVLEAGIQSFTRGPDGTIYGGALGMGNNGWSWLGRLDGLMKWKPDGKALDAIVSAHSHREGFDIRFDGPLGDMAANPDLWWVSSYRYQPTSAYGGPRLDMKKLRITRIRTSTDRATVSLTVAGLEAGRVYRIALSPGLKTAAGRSLWTLNAWYTLNRIADRGPLDPVTSALAPGLSPPGADVRLGNGSVTLRIGDPGPWRARLVDIGGRTLASFQGQGPATREIGLPQAGRPPEAAGPGAGPLLLHLVTPSGSLSRLLPSR